MNAVLHNATLEHLSPPVPPCNLELWLYFVCPHYCDIPCSVQTLSESIPSHDWVVHKLGAWVQISIDVIYPVPLQYVINP